MAEPLVSICVPTYNSARFIEETLNSITSQTYRNVEILVGDNCCTDGTGDIVERLRQTDPRIVHVRHESNLGYVGNLNRLLELARGEYVAFYHADDVYEPTLVQREVDVLSGDSRLAGVFCQANQFGYDLSVARPCIQRFLVNARSPLRQEPGYVWGDLPAFLQLLLKNGNVFFCPSFMTRRDSFQKTGLWSDDYVGVEDINLWLRFLLNDLPLAIITEHLINYRIHEFSGTSTLSARGVGYLKDSHFRLFDDFLREHGEGIPPRLRRAYRRRKGKQMLRIACAYRGVGDYANYLDYLARSREAYSFPLWSKRGFMQLFPQRGFRMRGDV